MAPMQEPEENTKEPQAASGVPDAQWEGRVLKGGALPEEPEM